MNLYKDLYNCLIVNINYILYCIPYHSHYIFGQFSYNYISQKYLVG
jgi:hypothetical protein